MKLTDTERWLVDWLNFSGYAWPAPQQQFQEGRPKVVVATFDVEHLAKAIDKLLTEKGAIR